MYALEVQNKEGRRTTISSGEIYEIGKSDYKVIMVDPERKEIALEALDKGPDLENESYIEAKQCFFFVTGQRMMKNGVGQICSYRTVDELPKEDEDDGPDGGSDPDPETPEVPQNAGSEAQTPPASTTAPEKQKKSKQGATSPQNPVPAGVGA